MDKRYQVYRYGDDPDRLAGGQEDLGGFDERPDAEHRAREAIVLDGARSSQVIRNSDFKIVAHWDNEELS